MNGPLLPCEIVRRYSENCGKKLKTESGRQGAKCGGNWVINMKAKWKMALNRTRETSNTIRFSWPNSFCCVLCAHSFP